MIDKMDRNRALEVLGVAADATDEEIERRYSLLLKKLRSQEKKHQDQNSPSDEPLITIEEVNAAYNAIKGIEGQQLTKVQMGWNKESFSHFMHYYKLHVIIGFIILLIIGFTVKGAIDRQKLREAEALLPKPNVTVVMVGNYYTNTEDIPQIEQALLSEFPEWERIKVEVIFRPLDMQGQMDAAYLQKSMIELMTKKGDIYIMDQLNYDQLNEQEIFTSNVPLGDLSNNKVWSNLPIRGSHVMLAAISKEVENEENAVKFIDMLTSNK